MHFDVYCGLFYDSSLSNYSLKCQSKFSDEMEKKYSILRKLIMVHNVYQNSQYAMTCYDIDEHVQTTKHKLFLEVTASSLSVMQFKKRIGRE